MERSSLQQLHDQWQLFDMSGQRSQWDRTAEDIVAKRSEYTISRKKLAAGTKKFRTLSQEAQLKVVGSLLKSYQEEVDRLTQRSADGEKLFLRVYKDLSELPDPVVGLRKTLDILDQQDKTAKRIVELEAERKSLLVELAGIKEESRHIRDQGVTVRNLEEQLRAYETDAFELVKEQVQEREAILRREHQSVMEAMTERESELERQHSAARYELAELRKVQEVLQSKLLAREHKFEIEQAAKQSQVEMLLTEAERNSETIMMLERELQQTEVDPTSSSDTGSPDMAVLIAQKDVQIQQLLDRISDIEGNHDESLISHDVHLQGLLEVERTRVAELEDHLRHSVPKDVVDRIRNQLAVLKSEHDIGLDLEVTEDVIRQSLKAKNKKLETECMQLKVSLAQAEFSVDTLQKEVSSLEEDLLSAKALIAKLEDDLCQGTEAQGNGNLTSNSVPKAYDEKDDFSMLEIVCKQRDRFKLRVQQLEEENQKLNETDGERSRDIDRLRDDNVKLYTKVRFLQSYNRVGSSPIPTRDLESGDVGGKSFSEYGRLYEAKVDPFLRFKGRERQDRIKSLNAAERMTLQTSRFVLANKFSRMFIFFYSVALHLLVFVTLYMWSSAASPQVYVEE